MRHERDRRRRSRRFARAASRAARSHTAERFALHPHFQRLTLAVILRAVFGVTEGPRFEALRVALERMVANAGRGEVLFFVKPDGSIRLRKLQETLGPLAPLGRF